MNLFDVLIVLALMAGAAWGFIKGLVHQAIGVGLVYISLIAATMFYSTLAPWLAGLMKLSSQAAGAIAFLFLLIVTLNILAFVLRDLRKREFKVLRLVNQLGGMTCGFLITCVWVALGITLLHYSVLGPADWHDPAVPTLARVPTGSFQQTILSGLSRSPLVDAFSHLLPPILSSVSPFAPTTDVLRIFIVQ